MNNKRKQFVWGRGFTLLELIVAMALMNVIALALYASMHIVLKAKRTSQAAIKPYRAIVPAFESLRNDISGVMVPDGLLAGPFQGQDLNDTDFLRFYTCSYQPNDNEAASNIILVEYFLQADTDRQQMVLKRGTIKNLLSTKAVEPEEEIIARNITGFDVKYYDGYSWLDEWDSTALGNVLPWGIKVTLLLSESSAKDTVLQRTFSRVFLIAAANPNAVLEEQ